MTNLLPNGIRAILTLLVVAFQTLRTIHSAPGKSLGLIAAGALSLMPTMALASTGCDAVNAGLQDMVADYTTAIYPQNSNARWQANSGIFNGLRNPVYIGPNDGRFHPSYFNFTTGDVIHYKWVGKNMVNGSGSGFRYFMGGSTNGTNMNANVGVLSNLSGDVTHTADYVITSHAAIQVGVTRGNNLDTGNFTVTATCTPAAVAAAPAVSAISPSVGPALGGTSVSITGTDFTGATAVMFGATAATAFTVNSATSIVATAPAGSGTVDVRVTTGNGTSAVSAADQFTYVTAPTVTSISPIAGPTAGGTTVVITGTGFSAASGTGAVKFGGTNASYTINGNTQITATAPANAAGTYDITVTTPGGTSATSSADQFTYVAAPTVSGVSPIAGPTAGGTTVVITGTGFAAANPTGSVKFGAANATYVINSNTQITATSPANTAGTYDITVTTFGGTSATSSRDQFTYVAAPSVTGLSPASGPVSGSTTVVITGTGFTGATAVTFDAANATSFTVNSATQITATSPMGAVGSVDVRVTSAGGTSATSQADQFTYIGTPSVLSVTPYSGPATGGTTVTISGKYFANTTAVMFGATPATGFTVVNGNTIEAIAPAGAVGTVDITVTAPGGTSGTGPASHYTYFAVPNAPAVTGLSPATGPAAGGTSVVITGTDLTGATAVTFDGTNATSFTVDSDTQITAVSPMGAVGSVDVHVTTPGGTSATSQGNQFTYIGTPSVLSISPASGPATGGTTVTITGKYFAGTTAVKFGASPATGFTVVDGNTITATAPAGTGTVDITVTAPGGTSGTSATDQFTYVAAPAVSGVYPSVGPVDGGTTVVITGSGFTTVSPIGAVKFGAVSANYVINSNTQITATAPAHSAGTVDVTVTSSGPIGGSTSITISGTSFPGSTSVFFGGSPTQPTSYSPTQFTTTSPSSAGSSSATSQAGQFTYVAGPTVTGLNQTSGPAAGGNDIVIYGTNLTGTSAVMFGNARAIAFTVMSDSKISATVPAGTGTVDITVTTPGGTSATSQADRYSYAEQPAITGTSPNTGPADGGTTVIVLGTGFTGATSVMFGSQPATSFSVDSATQITATAPAGTNVVDITVTTPNGTTPVTTNGQFAYVDRPVVTTLLANHGVAGDLVTIIGSKFTGAVAVNFGNASVGQFTVHSDSKITAFVPAGTGAVDVTVVTHGGVNTTGPAGVFTYSAAPVAADVQNVAVAHDTAKAIDLSGSITGQHSSIAIGTAPAKGSLSVAGDVVTYTPATGYAGVDSFTYTATGIGGTSSPATVSLTVAAAPFVAPVASDRAGIAVPYNGSGTAIDLSSAITGQHSTLTIASAPAHGSVNVAGDVVTYTPNTGYYGTDSFTFTATGQGGTSRPATVGLTIAAPGAPVITATPNVSVAYGSTGTAIDLSGAISGVRSGIAIATQPAHGTVTIAGDVVTYTPNPGYYGADSFTYTATGPGGTSAPVTIGLTVGAPAAPVAADKAGVAVAFNSNGTAIDLAGAISGVHSALAIATAPAHGTVSVAGDVITYTPATGYFGADSFSYVATGPGGSSAPATVKLSVAMPPAPVAEPTSATVGSSVQTVGSVDVNLSALVSGDVNTIEIVQQPQHGRVVVGRGQGSRAVGAASTTNVVATYEPNAGYHGPDSFSFVAVGPGGRSPAATVSVTVIGAAPVAQNKTASTTDGQTVSVDLTAGATEGPFTAATIVSVSPAAQATARIVEGGTATARTFRLDVTPAARFGGNIVVTYTLTSATGVSAPATVTVAVQARPAPSQDPNVRAISDAQAEATRRFAQSQTRNFIARTEQLHNGGGRPGATMGMTLASRDQVTPVRRASNDDALADIVDSAQRRGGDGDGVLTTAEPDNAAGDADNDGVRKVGSLAIWSGGAIEIGTRDRTTDRTKITATSSGLSAGADLKLAANASLGLGGGVGFDTSRIAGEAARVTSESSVLATYGSVAPVENGFLDIVFGYGQLDFRTRRAIAGTTATGSREGDMWFGAASAGIDRVEGALRWSVYGRGEWLDADLQAYRETGAGNLNLRFDGRTVRSLTGVVGGRLEFAQKTSFGSVRPRVRTEWSHEFQGSSIQALDYADIAGVATYGFATQGWTRNQYSLALGSSIELPWWWTVDFDLDLRASQGGRSGRFAVKVSKGF